MMENKCNQTPNKYLDHVYCQPSTEGRPYIRSSNNNNSGGNSGCNAGSDFLAMLKENKQLKAMLILHLDLIQEQSDQLIAKDKQINNIKEELQVERNKTTQLEAQVQELQRQLQRQIKRAAAPPVGELSLSPPPLAKIQCQKSGSSVSPTNNIIGECNGKLISKIVLQRGSFAGTHSPNSTTTISDSASEDALLNKNQDEHEDEDDDIEELTTEESNDATDQTGTSKLHLKDLPRGAKARRPLASTSQKPVASASTSTSIPMQVCVTPPTPSRGKQMPLMLWHAPDMHSEEESCDSAADGDQLSTPAVSPGPPTKPPAIEKTPKTKSRSTNKSAPTPRHQTHTHKRKRRCTYLTTLIEYPTREWEDEDEKVCDYEFSQAEADAIHAEAPMLEIPKWTEHDLSPSYCIEGTEDLSDESFLKRHAKLEIDEKRRKKWDVQQIREQRRIEKLKQRHYKNDIQEEQTLKSFFPQPEGLQSICYVNELPVQAFGEMIPKINLNRDFMLPWLQVEQNSSNTSDKLAIKTSVTEQISSVEIMGNSIASSTSAHAQQQLTKSSFVFLKKRKRQQSSSAAGATGTMRQRSLAAKNAQQNLVITANSATNLVTVTETLSQEQIKNPGEEQK